MNRATLLDISFVMLLVALPLISFGSVRETPLLWGIGFAFLIIGFLIPVILRFIPVHTTPEDEPELFEEPS
jgi:hypothetical protein